MKYDVTVITDKVDEVKALITALANLNGCQAETRTVLHCGTDNEPLVRMLQAVMPKQVVVTHREILSTQLLDKPSGKPTEEEVTTGSDPSETVMKNMGMEPLKVKKKQTKEQPVVYAEKECPGCGNKFTPKKRNTYRCQACSKAGHAQRSTLYTVIADGEEHLYSKALLMARMIQGDFEPGVRFTNGGKNWIIVKENGQFDLVKA